MKKALYIAALTCAATVFTACEDTYDPFGGKTPSERIEAAITTLDSALQSSANGWEMRYFPTPNSAGYAMLLKFDDNTAVQIAGKNSFTKDTFLLEESYYQVEEGNGALLTFHTYNRVLHAFSDPKNPDGKGQQGDYEFYLYDGNSLLGDQIILQGKKRGTRIVLTKLADEYKYTQDGNNWKKYFGQIDEINKMAFLNNNGGSYKLTMDGNGPIVTYNNFTFIESDTKQYGFVLTPTGLHFYEGFKRNGYDVFAINYELAEDANSFTCTDENVTATILPAYSPLRVFAMSYDKVMDIWAIDYKNMGTSAQAAMTKLEEALKVNEGVIREIDYVYVKEKSSPAIRIKYSVKESDNVYRQYEAVLYITMTFTPSTTRPTTVTFAYKDANQDGTAFLRRLGNNDVAAGINLFNAVFAKEYSVSCAVGGELNPSYLLFTAKDDKDHTFVINKKIN